MSTYDMEDLLQWHRRQRKYGHNILQGSYHSSYHGYPALEAKRLLVKLLEDTENYSYWLDQYTARIICRLAYRDPDHSVDLKKNALALLEGISPAGKLPNILPQLMLLPERFNPWSIEEKKRYQWEKRLYFEWQDKVRREMAEKRAKPSCTKTFLEQKETFGFDEPEGAYAVGMMALAGVQTIASPLNTFIFAMVHHPVRVKAVQEEIDKECGDRMPVDTDSPLLPTFRAVLKECIRWRPPVPTGIPHELTQDNVWNGYFIPKGAHVHPLEWAISRDETVYPDPEAFRPERWLDPQFPTYKEPLTQDPMLLNHHQFGYGRRVCQGQELVEAELLAGCGAIAWSCSLTKQADDDSIPQPKKYTSLLITKPTPFAFEAQAAFEAPRAADI